MPSVMARAHPCRPPPFPPLLLLLLRPRFFSANIPGMTRKRKEKDYERLVDLEKPYKKMMALKDLLLKEPENVLSLAELDRCRSPSRDRFRSIIVKHPGFFKLYKDEDQNLWCGFQPHAQLLVEREQALRRRYESISVQNLRKLLMMSVNRRLRVPKIAQLRKDLGFPVDFHSRLVYSYPQYFRVVEEPKCNGNEDGPLLELTSWDPSLAITSLEVRARERGELNSEGEPMFKMCVSQSLKLSEKQQEGMARFQERPFISPYADTKDFNANTLEFEKRQVALVHEILSMTLEKKILFDYLTHFRKEYRLPQNLLAMVIRHHSIFYVSRKGGRFVVFLKEAYDGTNLVHKNEWILLKEEYAGLMDGKKPPRSEENRFIERSTCLHKNNNNVATTGVLSDEDEGAELHALVGLLKNIKEEDVDHH